MSSQQFKFVATEIADPSAAYFPPLDVRMNDHGDLELSNYEAFDAPVQMSLAQFHQLAAVVKENTQ